MRKTEYEIRTKDIHGVEKVFNMVFEFFAYAFYDEKKKCKYYTKVELYKNNELIK